MREHPILFSAPMVLAILEGRKTQTRRVVKPAGTVDVVRFIGADNQPTGVFGWCPHQSYISDHIRCPYGAPSDRLWVRETWAKNEGTHAYEVAQEFGSDFIDSEVARLELSDERS